MVHSTVVKVPEQRVNVALHDHHTALLEHGLGVGPAALPKHPKPFFTSVVHALQLGRLRHALPDVLATDIPTPAARERRQRQRRVAMTAEAAPVEVGHGREGVSGGGHFELAAFAPIYCSSM